MFHVKNNKDFEFVYVSSHEVPVEIKTYYQKILQLYEIPAFSSRIHFITARNPLNFPHFSPNLALFLDEVSLKKVKQLTHGKCAYLISNFVHETLINLCVSLEIPHFGGNLDAIARKLRDFPLSFRETFEKCGFPVKPFAKFPGKSRDCNENREFLIVTLAKLILSSPNARKWGFFVENPEKTLVACLEIGDFFENCRETLENRANALLIYLNEVISSRFSLSLKAFRSEFRKNSRFCAKTRDFSTFSSEIAGFSSRFSSKTALARRFPW